MMGDIMYVSLIEGAGVIRQLTQVTEKHFDELLDRGPLVGTPVYFCTADGIIKVWPRPEVGVMVCRLEPQAIA